MTHQVYDASAGQPHGDEDATQLREADGRSGPEHVEVLQDVRNRHQAQCSQEPQSCQARGLALTFNAMK